MSTIGKLLKQPERMPGIISVGCYGLVSHPGGSAGGGDVLLGWGLNTAILQEPGLNTAFALSNYPARL